MRNTEDKFAKGIGREQARAVQEALKPHLRGAGVRRVAERIGKPGRFFEYARRRRTIQLEDFLATCAVLDLDPVELMGQALRDESAPEARQPRILAAAWERIDQDGEGLGEKLLADMEASFHTHPRDARAAVRRHLRRSKREELPRLLGIYASALRSEANVNHAALVLREAGEMARRLDLPAAEADLLIRLSYLALEQQSPARAIRLGEAGTLAYARLDDREGEGKGFLATGIFRYYNQEYRHAARDLEAALRRSQQPRRRFSAHLNCAFCWLHLEQEQISASHAAEARLLAPEVDTCMRAKLSWLDARLSYGTTRFDHLRAAQTALASSQPADCLLVTLELVEELLLSGHVDEAGREVPRLCDLVERAAENWRVQKAVSTLISHRSRLTPGLVVDLRRALDDAHDRRLSNLISSEM